jgi:hypothetical protein
MKKLSHIASAVFLMQLLLVLQPAVAGSNSMLTPERAMLTKRAPALKPSQYQISSKADITRVVVKFREASFVRLRGDRLISLKGHSLSEVNALLLPYLNGRLSRLFSSPEKELDRARAIYEAGSQHELADLNLYYQIDITDPSEAEMVVGDLNGLDIVEIAYAEPKLQLAEDIDPPTPDFEPSQTYLLAAPGGIDAVYANSLPGGDGTGVKIIDLEFSWNESHEDLEKALGGSIGYGDDPDGDHGTAVLGAMIAGDNGYGVTGICSGADVRMVSVVYRSAADAIFLAVDSLDRGDVMLLELHAPGPRYDFQIRPDQLGYICVEYWQANFDVILYAWAKGIIVVEAAGNGAENYDDPLYGQLFDTTYRNSHAIIVGAGAPPSGNYGVDRSRLSFSNYGERVNLQGYGKEVFTTGFGSYWDGGGDPDQYYTAEFDGTSAASPIVTGALVCLQGYYISTYGIPFTSDYGRDILYATGSPQQENPGEHIGPRPDLTAAIAALGPPASLYVNPVCIDTAVDEGLMAFVALWLHNRSTANALDFETVGIDSLDGGDGPDWLTVSPETGTVPMNDSLQLTVSLDASIIEGGFSYYRGMIEINWGISAGVLDSISLVPVYFMVQCLDDSTFLVRSSADPGGPVFEWVEIKDIGTAIPDCEFYNSFAGEPLDDGTAGPFDLPFEIPFYDTSYSQFYVGVNGAISFTEDELNDEGYYSPFTIPDNPFTTFIAPFWSDLTIDEDHGGNGDIYCYYSPTDDSTIIEWYHVGNFDNPRDTTTTFQIVLTDEGDIIFRYLEVGWSELESTALIGLNAEGCAITPYFNEGEPLEHKVADSVVVQFDRRFYPVMAGDCNGDSVINLLDVTNLINYLYKDGPAPEPIESADPNCDEAVNILDGTYLINYLYKDGPEPCYYQAWSK